MPLCFSSTSSALSAYPLKSSKSHLVNVQDTPLLQREQRQRKAGWSGESGRCQSCMWGRCRPRCCCKARASTWATDAGQRSEHSRGVAACCAGHAALLRTTVLPTSPQPASAPKHVQHACAPPHVMPLHGMLTIGSTTRVVVSNVVFPKEHCGRSEGPGQDRAGVAGHAFQRAPRRVRGCCDFQHPHPAAANLRCRKQPAPLALGSGRCRCPPLAARPTF